jgi:hypothetical protein
VCKSSQEKREKLLKESKARQDEIEGSGIMGREAQALEELENEDYTRPSRCCMQRVLSLEEDFRLEKPLLQVIIEKAGHKCFFLPKFHCELNPIEMVWGKMKYCMCSLCSFLLPFFNVSPDFCERTNGTFQSAKHLVPECLDMVTKDQICQYFYHCWRYMDAYRCVLSFTHCL